MRNVIGRSTKSTPRTLDVPFMLICYFNTKKPWLRLPDIDECKSSPCENGGRCANDQGNYTCTCISGFTGRLCEKGNVAEL